MVIVLAVKEAVTPVGNPIAVPIPVTSVVVWVMSGITVFTHNTGDIEAEETVLLGRTVMVPIALIISQPPVNGIV